MTLSLSLLLLGTSVDLTSEVTGVLPIAIYGGTNQSTYTTGDILYSSATNTLSKLAIGSTDQMMVVSSGGVPSWTSNPGAGGTGVFGYWQRASGALAPANVTDDFLVGGTSTASAKFAVVSGSGNITSAGTLTLPNSNTLTGQSGNLQFSQGISVGGGTTYYINTSGNANFNTSKRSNDHTWWNDCNFIVRFWIGFRFGRPNFIWSYYRQYYRYAISKLG